MFQNINTMVRNIDTETLAWWITTAGTNFLGADTDESREILAAFRAEWTRRA